MSDMLIGRQPIFNRSLDVIGYELLYRTSHTPHRASFVDGDQATTQVLLNAFSMVGFENLVGKKLGFVNVTENFLLGKYPIPFPPGSLALEVLENVNVTPLLIEALHSLSDQGYLIALDDVKNVENVLPLLEVASIIKIDLPSISRVNLQSIITYFKQAGVKLLAEKVETFQEYEYCQRLGFDYFQGYFLYRPNVIRARRIDSSKTVIVQALAAIKDPGVSFNALDKYLSRDVTITYKLLKLVNSAYFANRVSVRTISQAISMIGTNYLVGWLTLLLFSSSENKPHELTVTAMMRARFCEQLAKARGVQSNHLDIYFIIGLFSIMDAFFDQPLEKAIQGLPFSEDVVEAMLFYKGDPGKTLEVVLAYEKGDLTRALDLDLSAENVTDIYAHTLEWVNALVKTMQETTQKVD
ncbi:MAG: HDOD domain-containing protein [Anaerolineae bacterium]|nr:HDOD domain-containing protein [Anaerolineae bacterium]